MSASASTRLIGRTEHLRRIEAFLGDPIAGSALVLEGEPGIGKTTLWRAGVEIARKGRLQVLEARPAEAERELSFGVLGDLLAGQHNELGALPAPQRRALRIALLLEEARAEPPDQRAVGAALRGLFQRLSEDQPVVVALDDLQWVDAPSGAALQFALRRLHDEPVLVLAAARPGSLPFAPEGAAPMELEPLSPEALGELVRDRFGVQLLRPTLQQLERASGGNPFYALELADALLRSGRALEPGESLPIPARLHDLVRRRLSTLSPTAREAAVVAAALAQPTARLVSEAASGGVAAVADAVAARVLVQDSDALRFAHPLLASSLYWEASEEERRELHSRLAAVVVDPEERARHVAGAADGPSEPVAGALEAAAAAAAKRGAPDAAARFARLAVELTPSDFRADRHDRTIAWARYSLAAGDPKHAETVLERHFDGAATGRERAELELELGTIRLATRGVASARESFERAWHELGSADEPELRTRILIELASTDAYEPNTVSLASAEAVVHAERCGRPDLLSRALGAHATILVLRGDPPADDYWERALNAEKESGELHYGGPTNVFGLAAWMLRGDIVAALEAWRRLAADMARRDDPRLPEVLLDMSEAARIGGDWGAAAGYAHEASELAAQTGRESLEPMCLLYEARVALPRGDLDDAEALTGRALALVAQLPPDDVAQLNVVAVGASLLAQCAELSSNYAKAHEWSTAAIAAHEQLGRWSEHALAENLEADINSLVSLGALDEASRQLARLIDVTHGLDVPTLDGVTARAEGVVEAARGDSTTAIAQLERALQIFEAVQARTPWPIQLAWTLLTLGRVQRRAQKKQAARRTLERALGIFEQLGTPLWAERARAELGKIGGRPPRARQLTATEDSVARLVATGRSNAEVAHELFMSPKTVEWNLSKIYKKLGVRSRTQLAAKLAAKPTTSRRP